ncbi:MAG: ABC transporter ATP-binding protein [Clostridia bacterium]|nr:ABC transporter ATP-binding protein [Clostridia bacterium]
MIKKDPVLSVKDLKVSFSTYAGEVQAVRGVTWELGREETIAIVGESGCGKTVSIQTAMGLLAKPAGRIKEGSIIFDGKDITNYTAKQMRWIQGNEMTMIFQDPLTYLNPTMRVGRQIAEAYLQHHPGMKKKDAEERVLEFMRKVSLPNPEENMRRYPHELSGGMRQRVMVAMALICEPKILFADEPTTALDVTIQAQIIDLMKTLKSEISGSIVLITHDLGVVANMAERVYVMYAGQIVEHGCLDEIFENPRHPYTIGLLRSVPRLDTEDKVELAYIPGSPPDLLAPPVGCAFAERCPFAMNICKAWQPEYKYFDETHYSACWLNEPAAMEKWGDITAKGVFGDV